MTAAVEDHVLERPKHRLLVLDCPFCGEAPKLDEKPGETKIECLTEGCLAAVHVTGATRDEAVLRWNRRR
jgi:hypothetical protein